MSVARDGFSGSSTTEQRRRPVGVSVGHESQVLALARREDVLFMGAADGIAKVNKRPALLRCNLPPLLYVKGEKRFYRRR